VKEIWCYQSGESEEEEVMGEGIGELEMEQLVAGVKLMVGDWMSCVFEVVMELESPVILVRYQIKQGQCSRLYGRRHSLRSRDIPKFSSESICGQNLTFYMFTAPARFQPNYQNTVES